MVESKFYRIKHYDYRLAENIEPDKAIWLFYSLVQHFAIARDILINELYDPKSTGAGFNGMYLTIEKNRAFIFSEIDINDEFELDREHLLDLVIKWDELSKRDVQEIIIRRDGERFEIEEVQNN